MYILRKANEGFKCRKIKYRKFNDKYLCGVFAVVSDAPEWQWEFNWYLTGETEFRKKHRLNILEVNKNVKVYARNVGVYNNQIVRLHYTQWIETTLYEVYKHVKAYKKINGYDATLSEIFIPEESFKKLEGGLK